MPINFDQQFFAIWCHCRDGGGFYQAERYGERLRRDATVRDILKGEVERVAAVIEFNPFEGTSRRVTEDIAREVSHCAWNEQDAGGDISQGVYDFIEAHAGPAWARGLRVRSRMAA